MIDVHIHVVPPELPGVGSLRPRLLNPREQVAQDVAEAMRSAGITQAFAMGAWAPTETDPLGIANTIAIAKLVPGLQPIGIMDPVRGHDRAFLKLVEDELKRLRVVALKGYLGYLHFEPNHPGYRAYYDLAARYRIPVFFHTGDTYSPYAKLKFAQPLLVDEVAVDHPQTNFILAHVGNPWMMDAAAVIYKNLNVWCDLSGLMVGDEDAFVAERQETREDIGRLVRQAFRYAERPTRFLYGSDWPLIPMAPYRNWIASQIPPAFHEDVFRDNARKLFSQAANS